MTVTVPAPRDIVLTLLDSLGSRREAARYLAAFSAVDRARFAIIRAGGRIVSEQRDELAGALAFLCAVGLFPVVVHDAAAAGTARAPQQRARAQQLGAAARELRAEGVRLADAVQARGGRARPIAAGVFEVEPDRPAGRVRAVHTEAVTAAVAAGYVPLVAALGETAGGQLVDLSISAQAEPAQGPISAQAEPAQGLSAGPADAATSALARALAPHKIVHLSARGGLRDAAGALIPAVNLVEDHAPLAAGDRLGPAARRALADIDRLLADLPDHTSVSITAPAALPRELFTHRGAGTLIRRGEPVRRLDRLADADPERVRALVERAFGRPLAADYLARRADSRIYLVDSYRAAAIVAHDAAVPYLDKFAVTREAQGLGLGASVWRRVRADHPALFWRARADNPINGWYFEQAAGAVKRPPWVVFWYGLDGFADVAACVERAVALPASLGDGGGEGDGGSA